MDARRKTRASGSLRRTDTDCRAVTRNAFIFREGDGKREDGVLGDSCDVDLAARRTRGRFGPVDRPLPAESDGDATGWRDGKRKDFSSLVRVSMAVRLAVGMVVYLRQ